MALHGPDEFLADVSEDRDYPGLLVPATVKLAKEEKLEWQSNKDAFHAVETRMLSNAQQQNHRVSASGVEAGIGKSLLRSMPARKCKKNSAKVKNKPGRLCPEDSAKVKRIERECTHCGITQTPQWRHGPLGRMTLCNACGVRYKCGRLCPEYRPANSPTFSGKLHSNAHRKVMEMRKQKYGTVSKPVNICVTTSALTKSHKDLFPAVTTVNILEQSSRNVIAER
ncbi:hypothetical protein M0R45_002520 [Rubus argutus]|uniref:GATA-type domain-containing protein n=1 Tax=Rubus argutus TaxID=59490 RepID=A0AAW1VQ65_RUBAR